MTRDHPVSERGGPVTPVRCQRCRTSGTLEGRLFDPGSRDWGWAVFGCPDCVGVGWRDPAAEAAAGRVYVSVEGVRDERPFGRPRPVLESPLPISRDR